MGALPGVREGIHKGFTGGAPPNPARHDKRRSGQVGDEEDGGDGGNNLRTYSMDFPSKTVPRTCPVEGCSVWSVTWTAMQVNF